MEPKVIGEVTLPAGTDPAEFMRATGKTQLFAVMDELTHVKDHPRLLVIITHGFIELIVSAVARAKCKHGKRIAGVNHGLKLMLLNEMGVLSDHHFRLLDWFRDQRNSAAHQAVYTLTANDLTLFADADHRDPANFGALCTIILFDLWQTFDAVVGPEYVQSLYPSGNPLFRFHQRAAGEHAVPLVPG